ncbi:mitochondrial protein Pet127-domain-containing protein, partial [Chytriomyces sp. MP71]
MLRGVDALAALVGRRALLSTLSGAAPKAAAKKQRKRLRARQEARAQAESDPKPDAIAANPLRFESVVHEETRHVQVARLAHGLDRVLFNPGIHWLKDPRTDTFNFDPFLETVTKPEDFNFDALPPYKIASADEILNSMAHKHKTKYFSSTSSITNLLAQFYHFFSQQRGINNSGFTMEFADQPTKYTSYQRKPTSALLKYKDGVYSIDQEKPDNAETAKGNEILMTLGKSLEKLLTAEKPEYATYLKSANLPPDHTFPQDEAFHYAILEGFLLRSQLDCIHPALPGKTFDIKTRASVIVRMDPERFAEHDDYRLTKLKGLMSSFEREYHDMARSAMLKYNLQVRIGRMDGIFVAYHNTHTMFGFQYISREEMNSVLFGSCALGDAAFALCVKGLEKVLDAVVARYGAQDVRVTLQ